MNHHLDHPDWWAAIHEPETYPHPVSRIEIQETHISWIVLTGDWVYKLKKPVNLGFVDFTTLELRRLACLDEIRLNQRTAVDLYDGVVELTADAAGYRFGGAGSVKEYAVRLRQFDQADLLDRRLNEGRLTKDDVVGLAAEIARLHQEADVARATSPYGTPEAINEAVQACFRAIGKADLSPPQQRLLSQASDWIRAEWPRLSETFVARKRQGWVRECHGDLHLGNLLIFRGKPTLFDALEFNPKLRWIDVMSDVAFLVMDFCDRHAPDQAWRVLNEWLQAIGDFAGLRVLRYYMTYRALVRAKVAAIRLQQETESPEETHKQHELLGSYLEIAADPFSQNPPAIILMHGISGSGKSYVAKELAAQLPAILIRSDVERKRLFGIWPSATPSAEGTSQIYSASATRQTYERLLSLTETIIAAGYPVIVDATFLQTAPRRQFRELAGKLNCRFAIVSCQAPDEVLRERIAQRKQRGCDPSDAELNLIEQQHATAEPISSSEATSTISMNTSRDEFSQTLSQVRQRIRSMEHV